MKLFSFAPCETGGYEREKAEYNRMSRRRYMRCARALEREEKGERVTNTNELEQATDTQAQHSDPELGNSSPNASQEM